MSIHNTEGWFGYRQTRWKKWRRDQNQEARVTNESDINGQEIETVRIGESKAKGNGERVTNGRKLGVHTKRRILVCYRKKQERYKSSMGLKHKVWTGDGSWKEKGEVGKPQ